jgi:hypothetical protein
MRRTSLTPFRGKNTVSKLLLNWMQVMHKLIMVSLLDKVESSMPPKMASSIAGVTMSHTTQDYRRTARQLLRSVIA